MTQNRARRTLAGVFGGPSPVVSALLVVAWVALLGILVNGIYQDVAGRILQHAYVWVALGLTLVMAAYIALRHQAERDNQRHLIEEANLTLAQIGEVTEVALSQLPLEDLLDELLTRVRRVLTADTAAVYLLDENDPTQIVVHSAQGAEADALEGLRLRLGEGVAGRAAEQLKPVIESDVSTFTAAVGPDIVARYGAIASVPMVVEGRLVGALTVLQGQAREFTAREVRLLQLVADRTASAVERTRLTDAQRRALLGAQHARRHLALLVSAGRVFITTVDDHEKVLASLVDLAVPEFADYGAVYLAGADHGPKPLAVRHAEAPDDPPVGAELQAFVGATLAEVMAAGVGRLVIAGREESESGRELLDRLGLTSFVTVPIRVRGLAFGGLILGTSARRRGYRPSDLRAVEELARRAAQAAERALLYREAWASTALSQRHARRLRVLLEAWLTVTAEADAQRLLAAAVEQARRTFQAQWAYLRLADRPAFAAGSGRPPPGEAAWAYLASLRGCHRSGDPALPAPPPEVVADLYGSWITVQIPASESSPAGWLVVGDPRIDAFTEEDEALASLLAEMVRVALTNSYLYQTTLLSEARLSALIEASPIGIVELSLAGEALTWNPAAGELFGWPPEGAARLGPEVARWAGSLGEEARRLGRPAQQEVAVAAEGGVKQWLEMSVAPVAGPDNEVSGLLLMVSDETERRQLSEQFQQAQRLEAVGRLAGGIAHDFNNLLTVILGYTDGLLRRVPGDDPLRERIASIQRAGQRGADLTRQLLTISRHQVITPVVLRPGEVVDSVLGMVEQIVGEQVRVHVRHTGEPFAVRIDRAQLEQVLLNLAANAHDAMPDGGDLYIETRPAHLQEGPDGLVSYVSLLVRDTGDGMTPEVLEHCLEPFFTTKDRAKGTGLGLAAVYGIVTQSGGRVHVSSRPGEGTLVSILLPTVAAAAPAPEADEPAPPELAGAASGVVLIVEDDAEVRELVAGVLREASYTCLVATDAFDALTILGSYTGRLDLLVTDIVMPGISGPELAATVTETRTVPVLFMTGYADQLGEGTRTLEVYGSVLMKPFTPRQLIDRVAEVLEAA